MPQINFKRIQISNQFFLFVRFFFYHSLFLYIVNCLFSFAMAAKRICRYAFTLHVLFIILSRYQFGSFNNNNLCIWDVVDMKYGNDDNTKGKEKQHAHSGRLVKFVV